MSKESVSYYMADTENCVPKRRLYEDAINGVQDEDEEGHLYSDDEFTSTRVWATCIAPVSEDVREDDAIVSHSIEEFVEVCKKLRGGKKVVFFHNLAYDGPLLISHLLSSGYTRSSNGLPATAHETALLDQYDEEGREDEWLDLSRQIENRQDRGWQNPPPGTFLSTISEDGTWYSVTVTFHHGRQTIEFRDSLKILPFSVDTVGKALKTRAKKLIGEIDYTKERPEGYRMTATEKRYIINDVLVMAEALGKLVSRSVNLLDSMTIGSACMKEYQKTLGGGNRRKGRDVYDATFPHLDQDSALRKAYHGGFCYVNTDERIYDLRGKGKGYVHDVNSLYPSVMYKHRYPVGEAEIRPESDFHEIRHDVEYIVALSIDFEVKPDHIPFVQVKGSIWQDNEHIRQSDGPIDLTFTRPEYELFLEQYNVFYEEVTSFWTFAHYDGPFDDYIEYWYDLKKNADNEVDRMIAKLMLNNLYGKLAQASARDGGIPYLDADGILRYELVHDESGGGHIACGAYITAYAKAVTVRAAQANFDIFLYADTDSLHTSARPEGIPTGLEIGEWKPESCWIVARYVRQKTYIELIVSEDKKGVMTDIEPFIDIKACGAPQSVKTRLLYEVSEYRPYDDGTGGQWAFQLLQKDDQGNITNTRRTTMEVFERFTFGLTEAGKLRRRAVPGGTVLEDTTFKIHPIDGRTIDPYTGFSATP